MKILSELRPAEILNQFKPIKTKCIGLASILDDLVNQVFICYSSFSDTHFFLLYFNNKVTKFVFYLCSRIWSCLL